MMITPFTTTGAHTDSELCLRWVMASGINEGYDKRAGLVTRGEL